MATAVRRATAEDLELSWNEEVRVRLVKAAMLRSDDAGRRSELLLNRAGVGRECGHYLALLLSGADARDQAALLRRLSPAAVEVLAAVGFLRWESTNRPPDTLLGSPPAA